MQWERTRWERTPWGRTGLDDRQASFVRAVLPGAEVVGDDSWGLLDTIVLHVVAEGRAYTVKACGPDNTHFPRELEAHRHWTAPLLATGDTNALVAVDPEHRVLVVTRVPGHLALDTPDATDPDVHRQAGVLLRQLHDQGTRHDPDHRVREHAKALAALDAPHRIAPGTVDRVRAVLGERPGGGVVEPLVPTHGDWHPRNWVVDDGHLRAIDFGRFAWRPATADLTRLAVHHWQHDPVLEAAFLAGYGRDPRDPEQWRLLQLREAVGTAVWAYAVGDEDFEAQGHDMLRDALAAF
ncbi:aminoglycoside phosphotransferase family protein [Curtobacterium sp. MCLR17_036]|uniref:aminoglycoside phosphotransferase family protein n=1 Tax=Curtobacterium sp. MCLR17_036 TaxID=2175620 RepID=UPI001C64E77C|nr:aminoglycoside phosphotransferase family protein [Curtobacterium sp. MCLR17_036]WIE64972.1 aminoglycoside phosphotransferase family protein [Curtobacterium sp. MCLR17_036]